MVSLHNLVALSVLFAVAVTAQTVTLFEVVPAQTMTSQQTIPTPPPGELVLKGPIGIGTASNGKPMTTYIREYRYSKIIIDNVEGSFETSTLDSVLTDTYTQYLNEDEAHLTFGISDPDRGGPAYYAADCTFGVGGEGNGHCVYRNEIRSSTATRTHDGQVRAFTTVTAIPVETSTTTQAGNNNNATGKKGVSIITYSVFLLGVVYLLM